MSNIDFQIDITPNGNQLRFNLRANKYIQADTPFDRLLLDLPEADVNTLRSGTADVALVERVTAQLSEWFMGDDLSARLQAALDTMGKGGNDDTMRLVINADRQVIPKLANLPLELMRLAPGSDPVVLHNRVEGLVHMLPGVGSAQSARVDPNWPLKVLIVRSNPPDLGGAVPEAASLRETILNLGQSLMPAPTNLVQVDLLSSEVGVPATWDALQEQLENNKYHVLVYLGHGDVLSTHVGLEPGGMLQMESEDGQFHESVGFSQLRRELIEHPVPVALLIGCMTAAEIAKQDPEVQATIDELKPRWMQGSQGVAQALVDSEAGVQVSVGMRYMLDTSAATPFLKSFFRSLLKKSPGNVEVAVREARTELFKDAPFPPSWSAPMLFRAMLHEPMFSFMLNKPALSFSDALLTGYARTQRLRDTFWNTLVQTPIGPIAEGPLNLFTLLDELEKDLRLEILKEGACLWPERLVDWTPGSKVIIPVKLFGSVKLDLLQGMISVGGDAARIQSVKVPAPMEGYKFTSGEDKNGWNFNVERRDTWANPLSVIPDGSVLFNVEVELGPSIPASYPISLEILETSPLCTLWPGNNMIIVLKSLEGNPYTTTATPATGNSTTQGNPAVGDLASIAVEGNLVDNGSFVRAAYRAAPWPGNGLSIPAVSPDLETLWRSESPEGKAMRRELREALLDAFDNQDLVNLINGAFPNDAAAIDTSGSSLTLVNRLLTWAVKNDRLVDVVKEACDANRSNRQLHAFANKYLK